MAKTIHSTLRQQVGDFFEITPGPSTDPTSTEITRWLNEGQNDIARMAPWWALKDLLTLYNPSLAAVSTSPLSGLPASLYKFAYATLNVDGSGTDDLPMRLVRPDVAAMSATNNLIYDANSPILWIDGTSINWLPATTGDAATGKLKFYYIKVNTALSADGDTTSLPEEYEQALIYFAAAMGKAQDEEWQQYLQLMQLYYKAVQDVVMSWAALGGKNGIK